MLDNIDLDDLDDTEIEELKNKLAKREANKKERQEENKAKLQQYSFDLGYCESTLSQIFTELENNPDLLEEDDIEEMLDEAQDACSALEGLLGDLEQAIDEKVEE